MNKRKVMYYVQPYYLDCCIEIIKNMTDVLEIHLIIEVSPESKNSTIINFNNLEKYRNLEDPSKVIKRDSLEKLTPYLSGCKAVKLLIFKSKRSFSPKNLIVGLQLVNYIKKYNIETIHFDGQSARLLYTLPLISRKKIFITIHDPIQHSGEYHWKINYIRKAYLMVASRIFFYSDYALKQYINHNSKQNKQLSSIRLKPYTYISKYETEKEKENKYILLFGRISYYKGIDILINSMKIVLLTHPDEQFVIAGDFSDNMQLFNKIKDEDNLVIINKHIEIEELASIISKSKFVVCPYRDATQSGVLMTSFAMQKPVVASNVGAFPEYIEDNFNGLLAKPNHIDFAEKINYALDKGRYKYYESNLKLKNKSAVVNESELILAYK
jgi:glycosyltransferase involved in cell wall biosynthesis